MLIIKGLLYKYGDDAILRAHYSGDYVMVDCTEYLTEQGLDDAGYSKEQIADYMSEDGYTLTYDNKTYYQAEYGPYTCDAEMELLSDVSEIEHYDYTTELE